MNIPRLRFLGYRPQRNVSQPVEVDESFYSLSEWKRWAASNRDLISQSSITRAAESVVNDGIAEPLTGIRICGSEITTGANLREGLVYNGVNSRGRAVLLAIQRQFARRNVNEIRAYAAEGLTGFARRMHFVFPRFIGSEYARNDAETAALFPIPAEDLSALSFADEQFDLVSSNEVLEHVPDMDQCLREMKRVLKVGGWHIGSVPFRFNSEDSIVKAKLVDGSISYLVEPEYHGNPMSSDGSLVFEIPGWDILQRCREAGFQVAFIRFIASKRHGCLSSDAGGIFVLCAQR